MPHDYWKAVGTYLDCQCQPYTTSGKSHCVQISMWPQGIVNSFASHKSYCINHHKEYHWNTISWILKMIYSDNMHYDGLYHESWQCGTVLNNRSIQYLYVGIDHQYPCIEYQLLETRNQRVWTVNNETCMKCWKTMNHAWINGEEAVKSVHIHAILKGWINYLLGIEQVIIQSRLSPDHSHVLVSSRIWVTRSCAGLSSKKTIQVGPYQFKKER